MSPLVRDLLMQGIVAGTAVRTAKKTSVSMAYYLGAACIAAVAFVFFAIAGYGWLLQNYDMPVAAAMTGSVVLFIAVLTYACGYYGMRRKKIMRKAAFDGNFVDNIEETIKSLIGNLEEPVKDNPKMALLMAALAGFAAGDHLSDRVH